MANLNSLQNKRISEMSRDDLILHILAVRNARRYVPKSKAQSKTKAPPKERKSKDLVGMLTPEQAAALYSQLMDGENGKEEEDGD